jgi:crotonobetainyl-CoA:carnitine CoA-transferase CaiB-like acyl-CoA transferase/MFS family permease
VTAAHPAMPASAALERRFVVLTALRWLPTGLMIPVTAVLMRSRGLSLAELGAVSATQGVVVFALELPTGGLADAWGRRRVLLVAGVLDLVSVTAMALGHDLGVFLAAWAVQGVFRALDSGPLEAWYVDEAQRLDPDAPIERGLARAGMALGAAIAVGSLSTAMLVAVDPVPSAERLALPLLVGLAVRAVDLVALARGVVEHRASDRATALAAARVVPAIVRAGVRAVALHPALRALAVVELTWGGGMVAVELFTGPRLVEVSDDPAAAVTALAVLAAVGWTASSSASALTGRFVTGIGGPARAGAALRVAQGLAVLLMAMVAGPVGLATGYLAFSVAHGPANAVHAGLVHRATTAELRVTVLSVGSLMARVGGVGAALGLGALASHAGIPAAYAVSAVLLAVAAPLYAVARGPDEPGWRRHRRRGQPGAMSELTTPSAPSRPGALDGLHVVEVSEGISGLYAAKLLADHGADVVKVERPDGDPLRRWSAATPDEPTPTTSALFQFLAGGRRSITATDPARVARALEWADIVLVGDSSSALVDDATLAAHRRPAASVVRITPYGDDGPLAEHAADELLLQAWSGLMSGCGTTTTPPLQMGIGHGRWATGAIAGLAALAAHTDAGRTGRGVDIEVTALEVMAVCLNNYPALYRQFTGNVSYMSRSGDWPQVVRCKDGWIGLCIFTAQQWADFAAMIGRPDLSDDTRLNSMGGRARNRELAESVVRPWLDDHTPAEIHELGGLFRVPVAFVGNGRAVLEMDHFEERGVFVDHPAGFRQPRSPFRMGATAVRGARPAPEVGADDDAELPATIAPPAAAPAVAAPGPRRPLDGVTVVDLTAFWAGPAATHLLATLGADVVKVEAPKRPDGMRFATVRSADDPDWMEYGPTFHGTNPAKRSVTIDFSVPEGREVLLRLVERADVVVENFTPRVMVNAGLDYDELRARRPDIVMLRMPAFGLDGPWRDHSGFAQTMEQTTGIAWLTGTPEVDPLVRSTIDPIAGIHGAFAVLAALEHRRRTGEGQLIEMPMSDVALNVAAEPIVTWSAYGHLMERQGNRGPAGAPQGAYRCAGDDQWVAISVRSDDEWQALVGLVGAPAWATDPGLATRAGRRARHDEIDAHIGEWSAALEPAAAVDALHAAGVPAAIVWPQMIQDELPQLAQRGFTQWLDHPVAGRVGHPGTGLRSPQLDLAYRAPAPTVGQHTVEVLTELLGLGPDELDALAELGAIGPVHRRGAERPA